MNIEGLGEKIIETFHDIGLITDVVSIYHLKKSDIEGLEGFGEKSALNIIASINESRTVPLHRFLYSLGIRHVGEQTAKDIAKYFSSIEKIRTATFEVLSEVEGVGEKVGAEVVSFFSSAINATLVDRLLKEVAITREKVSGSSKLSGLTFVITGTLPTLSRDEAKELIEKHGGKVSSSVSSKTSYLLAGESAGSKLAEALKLGVKTVDENELLSMI
jgi:DNA ligase (NAD+)